MKYYAISFHVTPCSQDACDILSALAGEAGCESFADSTDGLEAYVQQQLFDQHMLDTLIADFPLADTHISYDMTEVEDRDWNEAWEQEGFPPIVIPSSMPTATRPTCLIIHDGRHLPDTTADTARGLQIEIDTHQAFGTGTHETTRMICALLLETKLEGKTVLDCGCGTGILSICALKLGAARCTAYDIDEWSTENTRHNAVINQVEQQLTIMHGDASLTDGMNQPFDLVAANINRNILLNDMPRFVRVMAPTAQLILSGFYVSDCDILQTAARQLGLTHVATRSDGQWACMVFRK